jgi:hypothetical protein
MVCETDKLSNPITLVAGVFGEAARILAQSNLTGYKQGTNPTIPR